MKFQSYKFNEKTNKFTDPKRQAIIEKIAERIYKNLKSVESILYESFFLRFMTPKEHITFDDVLFNIPKKPPVLEPNLRWNHYCTLRRFIGLAVNQFLLDKKEPCSLYCKPDYGFVFYIEKEDSQETGKRNIRKVYNAVKTAGKRVEKKAKAKFGNRHYIEGLKEQQKVFAEIGEGLSTYEQGRLMKDAPKRERQRIIKILTKVQRKEQRQRKRLEG